MIKSSDGSRWRVDRHIPVALLLALAGQTVGGFWWAATVSANIAAMESRVAKLENNTSLTIAQGNQLAAVDAKMTATQDSIKEIKSMVMGMMGTRMLPLKDGR